MRSNSESQRGFPQIDGEELQALHLSLVAYLFPFLEINRNVALKGIDAEEFLEKPLRTFLSDNGIPPIEFFDARRQFPKASKAVVFMAIGLAHWGSYFEYKFRETLDDTINAGMPGIPKLTQPIYSVIYKQILKKD